MDRLICVSLCLLMFVGKSKENDILKITCKEDENVILPCSLPEALTGKAFDWKKDGTDVYFYENGIVKINVFGVRGSHFQQELISGNASIKIENTKLSDSGTYLCNIIKSGKSYTIGLTVDHILKDRTNDPDINNGKVPTSSVRTVNEQADWALLRCDVVRGSPKPSVVWHDSAGNKILDNGPQISEKDGYYHIVLETKVTKSGNYTCVTTLDALHHQLNMSTFVRIEGGDSGINILTVGLIGALCGALLVIIGGISLFCWWKNNRSG